MEDIEILKTIDADEEYAAPTLLEIPSVPHVMGGTSADDEKDIYTDDENGYDED